MTNLEHRPVDTASPGRGLSGKPVGAPGPSAVLLEGKDLTISLQVSEVS